MHEQFPSSSSETAPKSGRSHSEWVSSTRDRLAQLRAVSISQAPTVEFRLTQPAALPPTEITDQNPTVVATIPRGLVESYSNEATVEHELPKFAYAEYARQVQPDELSRNQGNDGRPIDHVYLENNEKARDLFINGIVDGDMYQSTNSFVDYIKRAHSLAAANNVYNHVGASKHGLRPEEIGVFRPAGDTPRAVGSSRREIAQQVVNIAAHYGDPYARRFAEENSGQTLDPNKTGMIHLTGSAKMRDFAMNDAYFVSYPDAKYIPEYMAKMTEIGQQIEQELLSPHPDKEKAARLIGQQYSYGAIIRPFAQVNNSLFMNLANGQLKMFGLRGVTHGIMDHAAQRMQTANFTDYFADRVFGRVA